MVNAFLKVFITTPIKETPHYFRVGFSVFHFSSMESLGYFYGASYGLFIGGLSIPSYLARIARRVFVGKLKPGT